MPTFTIRATARNDLKRIAKFTEGTWRRERRNRYLGELDQAFRRMADHAELGKPYDHVREGYRLFPVGSHCIFYRITSNRDIDIVRILHKRMDISRRLFGA